MTVDAATLAALFKAYDVRGLDEQLTAEVARAIGAAAARVLGDARTGFVVGHDMRPTSPELAAAFADGAAGQGLDVVMIGLCSTDGLYFASGYFELPGAMFTASHNPAGHNGIKMCRARAAPVAIDSGLAEIRDLAAGEPLPEVAGRGDITTQDVLDRFSAHVRSFVDVSMLRPMKIAIDAGNGMGGLVVPAVFDNLPIDVEELFFELDGTFPN
ncbi:MAG: phosphomannomutase, partial [Glaciecola sp.]